MLGLPPLFLSGALSAFCPPRQEHANFAGQASPTAARRSVGGAAVMSETARKARPVGSTPFYLPPRADGHEPAKPEPTDADAKAFRPTTTPLDFEMWPWKTSARSTSSKSAGYVSADQKGWRSKAEEDRTLSHPHNRNLAVPRRGWKQNPLTSWSADVTHGVWSCCHATSPNAPGCQSGGHTSEWCQCNNCGEWVPMERWASSKCLCHPGEPVHSRYGGMRWSCCGAVGYEGSRADYKGAQAWKEWRNKPLSTQTLREWQVWDGTLPPSL